MKGFLKEKQCYLQAFFVLQFVFVPLVYSENDISITKITDLAFGSWYLESSQQAVITVSPEGNVTAQKAFQKSGVSVSPVQFSVSGTANASFDIYLEANATSIPMTDGASHNLTINRLTIKPEGESAVELTSTETSVTSTFSESGSKTVYMGAQISIPTNQTVGSYYGSFTIYVIYP